MIKFDPHPGKFDSLQDACNYAYIQVLRQAKPSTDDTQDCVYRAADGSKCFVGHILSDDFYRKEMEGTSLYSNVCTGAPTTTRDAVKAMFAFSLEQADWYVLGLFQVAHDRAEDQLSWALRDAGSETPRPDLTWSAMFKENCRLVFAGRQWTPPRLNLQPDL